MKQQERMNVRGLSEPNPFEMRLQVPCRVRSQEAAEGDLRPNPSAIGCDFPCAGPTKGMSDSGGASHAGPCEYVHRDSTEASGGIRDRIPEGEGCDCDRSPVRQRAQL